jgi:hypothetical protein
MKANSPADAFDVVAAVIREWDPYGLLRTGSPLDEFDAEIHSLVRQLPRIATKQDAILAVSRVFSAAFDAETFKPEFCEAVGAMLFAALTESRLVTEVSS